MIYFTSDLHFFHTNIMKYCAETRALAGGNIDTMHELIIDGLNKRVRKNDTLYILGDVFFTTNTEAASTILDKINCTDKHLIFGNHDHVIRKNETLLSKFKSARDYAMISYEKERFVLMHFPIESWDRKERGAYHLHGHQHSLNDGKIGRMIPNRMDVGIDSRTDFMPWSIDECIDFMKDYTHATNDTVSQ